MRFSLSTLLLLSSSVRAAIDVTWSDPASVKKGMAAVAKGMTAYYTGNEPGDTPGNLPDPYYWWEAGAMFGALVDYWYYTGDEQFNEITTQALLHQAGDDGDYMPTNQSKTLGNDDQGFWGIAALAAAENKYPDPPDSQPGWLALAQGVFNTQARRWNEDTCNGGLKWQIYTFNKGFDYKNTISQGCFFSLASRLGRYTGNQSYVDWAEKTWQWTYNVGLISDDYHFYDGTSDKQGQNCTSKDHTQWTYNAGIFLYGAATLWNMSAENGNENNIWRERTEGILKSLPVFVSKDMPGVLTEVACEKSGTCNTDQRSFKAYLARWMAATTKVAPWTTETLDPILKASREAAVKACETGGKGGTQCGLQWATGQFDGSVGVGEQMAVLEVMGTAFIADVDGPLTLKSGGTSKSDPDAGSESPSTPTHNEPISTGDKAGAAILTILVLVGVIGGGAWLVAP